MLLQKHSIKIMSSSKFSLFSNKLYFRFISTKNSNKKTPFSNKNLYAANFYAKTLKLEPFLSKSSKRAKKIVKDNRFDLFRVRRMTFWNVFGIIVSSFFFGFFIQIVISSFTSNFSESVTDVFNSKNDFYSEWVPKEFSKKNPKLVGENTRPIKEVNFSDICGNEEAKQELFDVVDFLKNPKKYKKINAKIPKGVLLHGPPGCGKTLLARALAHESNVAFLCCESSAFQESEVGVGAGRVRTIFERAKKLKPAIIFIDEIDLLSRANAEGQETTNELLVQMDGFMNSDGVIVIGATNIPKMIDPALMRSGRFDRSVKVGYPEKPARLKMLNLFLKNNKIAPDVNLEKLAADTALLSGADLHNIVNTAKINAAKAARGEINAADLLYGALNVASGVERRSLSLPAEIRLSLAAIEAAAAIVMKRAENSARKLRRISIIPRGTLLSFFQSALKEESNIYQQSRENILAAIDENIAGIVGEEIICGKSKTTNLSSSKLEKATKYALSLASQLGMTEEAGLIVAQNGSYNKIPNAIKNDIDRAAFAILEKSEIRVKKILNDNKKQLIALSQKLVENETLTGDEIDEIFAKFDNFDEEK